MTEPISSRPEPVGCASHGTDVLGFTLSGEPIVQATGLSRQLAKMHGTHGRAKNGETCGNCDRLLRVEHGRRSYFKCQLFGSTHGTGSDWRKKWPACGLYVRVHDPQDAQE